MDLLQEKTRNAPQVDTNTISHVFSENESEIDISSVLRHFVVDRYIDAGIESGFDDLDIPGLPLKFVHTMLDAALRRLPPADPAGPPSSFENMLQAKRPAYHNEKGTKAGGGSRELAQGLGGSIEERRYQRSSNGGLGTTKSRGDAGIDGAAWM
jgi:hypothetical protein